MRVAAGSESTGIHRIIYDPPSRGRILARYGEAPPRRGRILARYGEAPPRRGRILARYGEAPPPARA